MSEMQADLHSVSANMQVNMTAGSAYAIVLDGYNGLFGKYQIDITAEQVKLVVLQAIAACLSVCLSVRMCLPVCLLAVCLPTCHIRNTKSHTNRYTCVLWSASTV